MKHWDAPRVHEPLNTQVEIPGSKSQTARALYLAATGSSPCTIHGLLRSRDTDLFAEALVTLGAQISFIGEMSARVIPMENCSATEEERQIDCGLAGTVMRFLPPLAALSPIPTHFDGDEQAYARPLGALLDVLETLGAHITYQSGHGHLPFTIQGPLRYHPGTVTVDASASSQFFSAMLLIAPLLGGALIRSEQELISLPHINMTLDMMRATGITWSKLGASEWKVEEGKPTASEIKIEADLSNAGPFLCAGILSGGSLAIPHWPASSTQPGAMWPELFERMGIETRFVVEGSENGTLFVAGRGPGTFRGITCNMSAMGEMVPTLAALLLFAQTPSTLSGIAHLRGHETDRLEAIADSIRSLGGCVEVFDDGLTITPCPLHGAELRSFADHRMATFAAIVGLIIDGVSVDDIACTSKTLPNFESMWQSMLENRGANV